VDLRRQFGIVRTWLPLIVLSVALAAGAAYLISNMLPKTYEAKSTMVVGQSLSSVNPDYTQMLVSQRLSSTYASLASKRPLLDAVISKLGLQTTADELATRVTATAPLDSTLLIITADASDPQGAADIANTVADQLIAASPAVQGRQAEFQASVDADLKATQDQIDQTQADADALRALTRRTADQDATLLTLETRLATLRASYATLLSYSSSNQANLLSQVEPAAAPPSAVSPRPLLNMLIAAALGLFVALGIAFAAEFLDDGVKDATVIEELTGLGTLGAVTRMRSERGRKEMYQLATLLYPRSGAAEAYRTLRTNIDFASVDAPIRTLLVTSSLPGEGKTVTAANLAIVFAQAGRRVLLVDADLRKPGVHQIFDVPNAHGLTTLLRSDDATLDSIAAPTEQANLRVITTGPLPPNPAELMSSHRMRTILDRLQSAADLIVLDSPPLLAVADSSILSSFMDGTVLVIESHRGRRRAIRQGREVLGRAGANILGVVLNRAPSRARAEYAGYYATYTEPKEAS